jgi:hypothetical protein
MMHINYFDLPVLHICSNFLKLGEEEIRGAISVSLPEARKEPAATGEWAGKTYRTLEV